MVFPQDRVQQRFQSRTFPLQLHVVEVLVVVFTVFLRFRAPQWIFQFLLGTLMKVFFALFPGLKKCEGTCSLQVGTGRSLELIHAGRLWRGEFSRGAGPGGEGGAPGLVHAGLHRLGGAQRRQWQDQLLEPSLSSDCLEDTAWRPGCLGRR